MQLFGHVETSGEGALQQSSWVGGQTVRMMASDLANIGYDTFTTNCLRRWRCVDQERLTQVTLLDFETLKNEPEKLLFIQQHYLYLSASLGDILRRFKKRPGKCDFGEFPSKVSFLLLDAYSALAIVELLRILVDEEKLSF